tara:strand:- start:5614 stop:6195 length:582 start_codon:yes stop_codon:yes gene_type:complete
VIGVLALQGNFDSHIKILKKINLKHKLVKTSDDLISVDGLIIPGGESTTITNLLRMNQKLVNGINELSKNKPILGSCAGLILMSKESKDSRIHNFGFLDVITSRNAYGRQVHSFEAKINVKQRLNEVVDIEVLFIRAPKIDKINKDVEILATFQEEVVAVRQGMHIGISCHPELLNETLIHEICFKGKHEISR